MLHRNGTSRILKDAGFKTDRIKIETPQILGYGRLQGGRQLSIGINLPLHPRPQHQTERTGMGTNEFQPRPAVEEPRTDHLENIDSVVEEISGNHGQLVLARPFLAGRIGRVDKKRHAEIKSRTVDRLELRIVQVDAT